MRPATIATILLSAAIAAVPSIGGAAEPWQEPQDTAQAIGNPDMYAWRLFVALNWPAKPDLREADPAARFGAEGRVVWESWPTQKEIFPTTESMRRGATPIAWSTPPKDCRVENLDRMPLQQATRRQVSGIRPTIVPGTTEAQIVGAEVRMNKASRDFIADSDQPLWHIDGQEAFLATGKTLDLPSGSKEIKAIWRRIDEDQKGRYHWALCHSLDGAEDQLWGLIALHVTTKDLPNWFWATFEHVDNNTDDVRGKLGLEGWQIPSLDSFSCPGLPRNCDRAPVDAEAEHALGVAIKGTKWENYRLRGTQIDFVTSEGEPTLLANSVIESGFQTTSSCITCHARATIGPRVSERTVEANRLDFFKRFEGDVIGETGAPDPGLFTQSTLLNPAKPRRTFRQLDFVWSFLVAERKPSSE